MICGVRAGHSRMWSGVSWASVQFLQGIGHRVKAKVRRKEEGNLQVASWPIQLRKHLAIACEMRGCTEGQRTSKNRSLFEGTEKRANLHNNVCVRQAEKLCS
ncbi:hypothetical protein TNCV_2908681 [Trichonephila clavipes]|nr:hypothetical protein TNCV_2908681 [Trichonephila clavipes]